MSERRGDRHARFFQELRLEKRNFISLSRPATGERTVIKLTSVECLLQALYVARSIQQPDECVAPFVPFTDEETEAQREERTSLAQQRERRGQAVRNARRSGSRAVTLHVILALPQEGCREKM